MSSDDEYYSPNSSSNNSETEPEIIIGRTLSPTLKIGTHNGYFHADEVLAVRMLKFIEDKKIEIIRTRNQELLDSCNIVVDVGKVYDPDTNRYDHHQTSCTETFEESSDIPLSSAGLIYKHFGKLFIQEFFEKKLDSEFRTKVENTTKPDFETFKQEYFDKVYREFYYRFIREIDANDNGVSSVKPTHSKPEIYNYPVYLVHGITISKLNSDEPSNDEKQLVQFKKAMQITWWYLSIHLKSIFHYQYSFIVDRTKIRNYYENRPHSAIIILKEKCPTWRQHLKYLDQKNEIVFSIYPRKPDNSEWGFSTMNPPGQRFTNIVDLIEENKMKELLTFPRELVFVHKNLFCGSATNLSTAIEACTLSYEQNHSRISSQIQTSLQTWFVRTAMVGTAVGSLWLFSKVFSKGGS